MASHGIRLLSDDGERVVVEAEAGEPWHPFVQHTLAQGWAGLENLSLIPGTVGAAPMQNIGAYGVEIKDVFAGLSALDRQTGELRDFSLEDCRFAYRDSLFKQQAGRWLILRVRFALSRAAHLHLEYGPVRQRLTEQGIEQATPTDVSRAICSIRSEKLPDPAVLGNAGSFFKNPLVPAAHVAHLKLQYPDLVAYPQPEGQMKVAAGWLIERAGWKAFAKVMPGCTSCRRWCWSTTAAPRARNFWTWPCASRKTLPNVSRSSWKWSPIGTEPRFATA